MSLAARLASLIAAIGADIKALNAGKASTSHNHSATQISDSTEPGRALLTAADVAAQRSALGLAHHDLVTIDSGGGVALAAGKAINGYGTESGGFAIGPSFAATGSASMFGYGANQAFCDLVPVPGDGVSNAQVRMFRATNTSGQTSLTVFFGDGSNQSNHILYGKGASSVLCRANGNLLIGKTADDGTYKAQVNGSLTASGPVCHGQYTLSTLPSAAVFSGALIDVTNATGGPKTCRSDGTNWKILNTNTTVS